jgi:hypothetical protein
LLQLTSSLPLCSISEPPNGADVADPSGKPAPVGEPIGWYEIDITWVSVCALELAAAGWSDSISPEILYLKVSCRQALVEWD